MKRAIIIILQVALSVAIIAGAIGGAKKLIATKQRARQKKQVILPLLVSVAPACVTTETTMIRAMGTVVPSKEVTVTPEVSGRLLFVNRQLVPGGRVEKGDTIVSIDARTYLLAVKQQEAAVERARFELKLEQGRQIIAQREWQLVGSKQAPSTVSKALALRKPHLDNAKASLSAALSGLERAKVDVERTTIRAPFTALVVDEFVDVGLVVTPQSSIARLVACDQFWVRASVPVEQLQNFSLPDEKGFGGATVRVVHETGEHSRTVRTGTIIRLLPDIDPSGRLARILVAIDNPLENNDRPLLLGSYVRVEIEGTSLPQVVAVPRTALHEGSRVYVMNERDELEIRTVEVVWRREHDALVSAGLSAGDRIIVSRVATPVPGMKLRCEAER